MYGVLKYLQPFMIFSDDISFKQYEAIKEWLDQHILDLKSKMINNQKEFSSYINYNYYSDIGFKRLTIFS